MVSAHCLDHNLFVFSDVDCVYAPVRHPYGQGNIKSLYLVELLDHWGDDNTCRRDNPEK